MHHDTCRKYLIRWSVPKEIEFCNELPKTLLGKIDFKVLQKQEDEKRGVSLEVYSKKCFPININGLLPRLFHQLYLVYGILCRQLEVLLMEICL